MLVGAAAVVLTLTMSVALTRTWGTLGLCIGILAGRAVQSIAYPLLVRASLGRPAREDAPGDTPRLVAVTAILFAATAALGPRLTAPGWPAWVVGVGASAASFGMLSLFLGPTSASRRAIIERMRSAISKGASA